MEHFANGVAIERDAIEVPDFIIQELVERDEKSA